MNDDWPLLERFAREGAQDAFAALVARHLNLVYSAARRQTGSRELAEEVAQSVFLELARQASRLQPDQPLVAWLHVVTRRTAINAVRDETRRRAREQAAAELSAMNPNPSAWVQVEPLLDEAVAALPETDRHAILLRFFEQKSLRDIGTALGTTEDAAQKRVSRALDQLRTLLAKRGVALTAAGLATDLSAHAIEAAPAALGTTISAGIVTVTAGLGTAAVEATQTLAMTTMQKSFIAVAFFLIAGTGLYEARVLQSLRDDHELAEAEKTRLTRRLRLDQQQRADAARQLGATRDRLAVLQASAAASKGGADAYTESEMRQWYARVDQIKQAFSDNPQWTIPELQLLAEKDWFNAAQSFRADTSDQVRETLNSLRNTAKNRLASEMIDALRAYVTAHDGSLPSHPRDLASYFKTPVDPTMLERYEMTRTGKAADVPKTGVTVMEEKASVDPEFDSRWSYLLYGYGGQSTLYYYVNLAKQAFAAAHPGENLTEPAQLEPFLKVPLDPAKVRPLLQR